MDAPISLRPILKLTAFPSFWAGFEPAGVGDGPALADQAAGLTSFLELWAREVQDLLANGGDNKASTLAERESPPDDQVPDLSGLLASLTNAANTLLKFKRLDWLVEVPSGLLRSADLVFQRAEGRHLRADELTVPQVALRLAAATSHVVETPRRTTIDDQGRVFNRAGERLFQFETSDVLKGRREYQDWKSQAMKQSRMAEG